METMTITTAATHTTKVYNAPKGDPNRAGIHMVHKLDAWHQTAIDALVTKGVQRLLNDLHSQVDAAQKPAAIKHVLDKLNAGETWADATGTRVRGAATGADPVRVQARVNARKRLKATMSADDYAKELKDADNAAQIAYLDTWLDGDDPKAAIAWQMAEDHVAFLGDD